MTAVDFEQKKTRSSLYKLFKQYIITYNIFWSFILYSFEKTKKKTSMEYVVIPVCLGPEEPHQLLPLLPFVSKVGTHKVRRPPLVDDLHIAQSGMVESRSRAQSSNSPA